MLKKAALLPVLLTSSVAFAQQADEGFYGGVKGGAYEVEENQFKFSEGVLGAFGGYKFNQHFAMEAEYMNLFGDSDRVGGGDVTGRVSGDVWAASLVPSMPLTEKWELFGKAGLARLDNSARFRGSEGFINNTSRETDFLYGVGLQWKQDNMFVRGEVQSTSDAPDFMIYSIGVGMRF